MAVQTTESRLPGGIANADSFGYATTDTANTVALISYLGEDLPYQLGTDSNSYKPILNTYVVIVDDAFLAPNSEHGQLEATEIKYGWKVELLTRDEAPLFTIPYPSTHKGIFYLNSYALEPALVQQAHYLRVTVNIYNGDQGSVPLQTLSLRHQRTETMKAIEYLKALYSSSKGAYIGREPVTRMVANDYRDYLLSTKKITFVFNVGTLTLELKTPPNIMAALFYQNAISGIFDSKFGENAYIDSVINLTGSPTDPDPPEPFMLDGVPVHDLINPPETLKLGVCQVKPHMLAMFLPKDSAGNTYTSFQSLSTTGVTERDIFDTYAALNIDDHIDIYNYLRFPKTNIQCAALLLDQLKEQHDDWKDLAGEDELASNPECVRTIATEYSTGPHDDIDIYTKEAKKSFPIGWSPYMKLILLDNAVAYETVNIQLLDIRSGKPIPNARVKKLVVKSTDDTGQTLTVGDYLFSPLDSPIIEDSNSLAAQKALKLMGYDIDTPSDTFGPDEKIVFNTYWNERITDGSYEELDPTAELPPPPHLLNYIIKEYNTHQSADENGILHALVPLTLLEGRSVHLEVGFWDCPIVLEKTISNTDSTALLRANTNEIATQFNFNWILEYRYRNSVDFDDALVHEKQSTNWDETIQEGGHFGWQVESSDQSQSALLKICEKLDIKTSTDAYTALDNNLFSPFYDEDDHPYHFVFFGMQWCQPIYDKYEDDDNNGLGNFETLIQNTEVERLRMHLVTKLDRGNTPGYPGKYYGRRILKDFTTTVNVPFEDAFDEYHALELAQEAALQGEDFVFPDTDISNNITYSQVEKWGLRLAAKIGDPVFAMRKGLVIPHGLHSGNIYNNAGEVIGFIRPYHNISTLTWPGGGLNAIDYLHLHHSVSLRNTFEFILPGQVVGQAGRSTLSRDLVSDEPGYLGINIGITDGGDIFLKDLIDVDNRIVVPTEELPYVFPCKTQVTEDMVLDVPLTEEEVDIRGVTLAGQQSLDAANQLTPLYLCQFANPDIVNDCWAAAEMTCPYINLTLHTDIQLQNQLRHLNERSADRDVANYAKDNNPQYYHPGAITGNLGTAPVVNTDTNSPNQLDTTQTVQILGNDHNNLLLKIRFPMTNQQNQTIQVDTWVEASLVGTNNRLTEVLQSVPVGANNTTSGISETRMAIYMFRKAHNLLRYDNYTANFSMDLPGQPIPGAGDLPPWTVLNQECIV